MPPSVLGIRAMASPCIGSVRMRMWSCSTMCSGLTGIHRVGFLWQRLAVCFKPDPLPVRRLSRSLILAICHPIPSRLQTGPHAGDLGKTQRNCLWLPPRTCEKMAWRVGRLQVEFLVLGPLRVLDTGRPVTIAAPRQRALLAALLVHANEVVSTDRLLDLVWGGDDSEVGISTLRYHISKLRDVLEQDRESGQDGIISTQAPGYVLNATPGQIDALGFETLAREASDFQSTDPAQALKLLDEALSMWQGAAYADFAYEEFARHEILRLEELRLAAIEDRFDALLALGREREVVAELQALVEEHPHRERLTGALMLTLYRSGRQADALAAYQTLRRELGEGLGIEPSKELVDLEGRILLQDDTLAVEAAPPAAEFLRGYALRGRIGEGAHGIVWRAAQPGVGREVAIKAIHPDIANRPGFVRRFEIEAQLVASLEHPHIVSLFDFWRDPDGAYLVMPLLRGGNLAHCSAQGRCERRGAGADRRGRGCAVVCPPPRCRAPGRDAARTSCSTTTGIPIWPTSGWRLSSARPDRRPALHRRICRQSSIAGRGAVPAVRHLQPRGPGSCGA